MFNFAVAGSTGLLVMKDLNLRSTLGIGVVFAATTNAAAAPNMEIHDILVHHQGSGSSQGVVIRNDATSGSVTVDVWNVAVSGPGGTINGTGLELHNEYGGSMEVENCTVVESGSGFHLTGPMIIRNCVSCDNYWNDFDGSPVSSAGYNNASDDASAGTFGSGSGCITGITPANEFVTRDFTSSDFIKVKSGGALGTGGTTVAIAGNTAGIRGNARPGTDSQYSMGADELVPISTVTVTSCSPNDGAAAGGTPVTVGGTGFVATPTVTFGGVSATSVVWVSATELTCVTPTGNGVVDVKVTNPDTGNGTLAGGFSYIGVAEEGASTPVTVPTRLGEGGAGIFRSSPGLGDVLNKIAVCLSFIKSASQQDNFAEFKTAMEDLVAPDYSPRPRYVTPYPAPDPEPLDVPRRTGEGRVGLNRAQTSEMGVGLKEVIDRISLMIQEIQTASQLADFAAFKAAVANVPVLNKSADSRV